MWRTLWQRVRPAAPRETGASAEPVTVLGVVTQPPREPAHETRTLRFRDALWHQHGEPSPLGIVTFVREIAVNGRAVHDEVQLHGEDLARQADGVWTLNGR